MNYLNEIEKSNSILQFKFNYSFHRINQLNLKLNQLNKVSFFYKFNFS
jgi:hypothetical protein